MCSNIGRSSDKPESPPGVPLRLQFGTCAPDLEQASISDPLAQRHRGGRTRRVVLVCYRSSFSPVSPYMGTPHHRAIM